jgi:hypothetical protein
MVKLPFLIQHYFEHKENDNHSLFYILHLHYFKGDIKDKDYEEDMKLPFKTYNGCATANLLSFFITTSYRFVLKEPASSAKLYPLYSDNFSSSAFLSSIWQPPKSC